MSNNTYNILLSARGINGSEKLTQRIFQDDTKVIFNVTDFNQLTALNYFPIKQVVDFGDSSPIISKDISIIKKYDNSNATIRIAEFNNITDALFDTSHTYYPTTSSKYTSLTAQIKITYNNFTNYTYYIPLIVSQNTYLNVFNTISIKSTQFVDTSANNLFMIITTNTNNLYNLVLTD